MYLSSKRQEDMESCIRPALSLLSDPFSVSLIVTPALQLSKVSILFKERIST
jgi:hypothetical protein